METFLIQEVARRALAEDLLYGDRTSEALLPTPMRAVGCLIAKEELVVAGMPLVAAVFRSLDPTAKLDVHIPTGKSAKWGDIIVSVEADARALLGGERTALNFIQRLSGIATQTRRFVGAVSKTGVKIADTRKTTPGLRMVEKEAVRAGGGWNHRFHLGDMVLIKDNHITIAGGLLNAIRRVRATLSHPYKVEVEATDEQQVHEALEGGCDLILLDNMTIAQIKSAVALIRKSAPATLIEVSGGVTLENVAAIAHCGIDLISVGALTHSAPAVDISMDVETEETVSG